MQLLTVKTITCLIVLVLATSSRAQEPEKEAPVDSSLRVLAYNVWYGFTRVPDRKPLYLDWMKAQDADVVLLQELNKYTPEMLEEDAKFWGHPHTILLKEDGFPTGITSRYPIEDIQKTLEGFHHGLIRAKIKDIYFYCIHLHPGNWEVRNREINLILEEIKGLPEGADIILAGDFNTFSPHDETYYSHGLLEPFFEKLDENPNAKNLRDSKLDYSVLQILMDAGFTDLEALMRKDDYQFTGSFPTLIEKPGEHGELRRLDYVFTNSELTHRVRSASIIADETTQVLSDHLPVIVDFEGD
ncbi:MAG: endonuclease/exonuclease/phosphatase family protein [Verrucomicrobiota bacterium]